MTTTVDTSAAKTALAEREAGNQGPSIIDVIRNQEAEIQRALPNVGVTAERFVRIVQTQIRTNSRLAACSQASLLGAMMEAAELGLEFGPLGFAWLVPYGNKATMVLGYKGIIELARRSDEILDIIAREVCENDHFKFSAVDDVFVEHHWDLAKDRGKVIGYYGFARYTNGGKFVHPMSLADIEKYRNRSRAKDSGPWTTDFDAMARKTCIRRMAPYLPLSTKLATAIATDEAVREFQPGRDEAIRVRTLPEPDPAALEAPSHEAGPAPEDDHDVPSPDERAAFPQHAYFEAEDGLCAECHGEYNEPQHADDRAGKIDLAAESPGAADDGDGAQQEDTSADPGEVEESEPEGDPQVPTTEKADKQGYENWGRPDLEAEHRHRGLAFSGKNMAALVASLRADDKANGNTDPEPDIRPF